MMKQFNVHRSRLALLAALSMVWLAVFGVFVSMPVSTVQAEESEHTAADAVTAAIEPAFTIAEARGMADTVTVAVYGEITAAMPTGSYWQGWIQDDTAGIRLYYPGGASQTLPVGQEVYVTGSLTQFNQDKQITVASIELTGRDEFITPEPLAVTIRELSEANEGQLVTIKDVWVTGNYTQSAGGVYITDGNDSLVIYAQAGSGLRDYLQSLAKSEDDKFDITGIHSRYHAARQIMPRGEADIVPTSSGEEPGEEPGGYVVNVASVTDGDTIKITPSVLGADTVRLLSIDTPEAYYMGQNQQPHADRASEALRQLLPPGAEIRIVPGVESIDAYGRLLAHIYVGDTDINREMIRLGHAVPYFIAPNLEHFEEYRAAYREAYEAERGIWNPDDPIEYLPYEFRFTMRGCPDKYVGDYATKRYVVPDRWEEVDTGDRIFFFTKADAAAAGYMPLDPNDPDAETCANPDAELMTITEARGQTQGTTVRVQGEVTAVFPSNAWIDDGEAGIRLFGNEASGLEVGEEIEVIGTLTEFNGDIEITFPTVTKLPDGNDRFTPPPPITFEALGEAGSAHAGRLIQLRNVEIKDNYTTAAGGVIITDGASDMIVYAQAGGGMRDYLQQLPKDRNYHFTGVAVVFHGNIQIFPRGESDIEEAREIPSGAMTGRVLAEGRTDHSAIVLQVTDEATEETVLYTDVVAADGAFVIEGLEPSEYTVSALLDHYISATLSGVRITAEQGADIGLLSAEANGGTAEGMLRAGELVSDGVIDIYDAVIIGAWYGQTTPEALQAADVNGDGAVDDGDLDLVRRNMLLDVYGQETAAR